MIELRVLTIGTFDLFHVGHLRLLKAASKLGRLTVGINTDEFVLGYKGSLPVIPCAQRSEIVGALECVETTRINSDTGRTLIRRERPDLLIIGSDWAARDYLAQINVTPAELEMIGTQLVYLPYSNLTSSTHIRQKIAARERA